MVRHPDIGYYKQSSSGWVMVQHILNDSSDSIRYPPSTVATAGPFSPLLQKSNHVTQTRVEPSRTEQILLAFLKVPIFPTVPTLHSTLTVMCSTCVQPAHISQNDLLLGRCAAGVGNSAHYGNGKKSTTVHVHMSSLSCACCRDLCEIQPNSHSDRIVAVYQHDRVFGFQ